MKNNEFTGAKITLFGGAYMIALSYPLYRYILDTPEPSVWISILLPMLGIIPISLGFLMSILYFKKPESVNQ